MLMWCDLMLWGMELLCWGVEIVWFVLFLQDNATTSSSNLTTTTSQLHNCRLQRILHERTNRHWTYATRYRCDVWTLGCNLIELHVTIKTVAALACCIGHTGCANVDDYCSGLHHIGCHKVGATYCSNDDVCLKTFVLDVLAVLIVLAIGGFFIIKLLGKRRMKKDLLSLGGGIGEKIDFKDDAKEINLVEQGSSEA